MGKGWLLTQMVLEKFDIHIQRNEIELLSCTSPPNYGDFKKWITDLNVRPEIVKLLEENTGGKLFDTDLGNDFWEYDTKSTSPQSENKQVRVHPEKLWHSKTICQQSKKAASRMGECSCNSHTR